MKLSSFSYRFCLIQQITLINHNLRIQILNQILRYYNQKMNQLQTPLENSNNNKKTIVSRGLLPIYYSTTSGMSKNLAHQFQSRAQDIGFVSPVMNIGDIDREEFLNYQGPIVLFLSTYGNGDSPADGQTYLTWLEKLKCENSLKKLSFIVLALGNSSFEHFCGHGRRVTQALLSNGAHQLVEMKKCDAHIESESAPQVFPAWCEKVLNVLTLKYQLQDFELQKLTSGFSVEVKKGKINWQQQIHRTTQHLGKQFMNFIKSPKAQVIHIKQLRNDIAHSGRSTLWVRIKKPESLNIWPACNIHIYPQNVFGDLKQHEENQIIEFVPKKGNKIPFPSMTIADLKKLVNMRQKPSNKLVKNAILLSDKPHEIKEKYRQIIKENKIDGLICQNILDDLEPSFEFYADLGLNLPRAYTLASWKDNDEYIDLCISTLQNGLTSNFLKSFPKTLRINSFQSTFTAPKKPLIMIANGSGIAPFRSIIQYVSQLPEQQRVPLRLYYGIQNADHDYYFKSDFEQYQKDGVVQIRLAESRRDPSKKTYVQELVEQDKQLFREHLFKKEGLVYICGGKQMEKAVNAAIFKAITLQCKVPYKGFTILNNFKAKKTIVQEVFG